MGDWKFIYEGWNPQNEGLREALCTLGNGYIGTRGAQESARENDIHYPGTYLAGGYNRMESDISGKVIENEDLVNWPNWLLLTFKPEGGEWFSPDTVTFVSYRQELDLYKGMLTYYMRFRDKDGKETSLVSRRIISMAAHHLAAISWELTPENWSGEITLRTAIDGTVTNNGVPRYRALNGKHLEPLKTGHFEEDGMYLQVQTRQSHIRMAQAARTNVYREDVSQPLNRSAHTDEGYVSQDLKLHCDKHHPVTVEKVAAIYTSKDMGMSESIIDVCNSARTAGRFDALLEAHARAWARIWHRCDITISGDGDTQLILRLHIFHLMQTASINSLDLDVGVPPRGLHGEAYRGHIMWDELFIFPFLNLRMPVLTREFLMYRYRRLGRARLAAHNAGYSGAMYPWQSGSNGREESQKIHLNPKSGRWIPDDTYLQRHVNVAIAYNVWQYYQCTEDKEFLYFFGAEMIFEIAKLFSSMARYNPERKRYEIHNVVGPDEYHTRCPGSDEPGLSNNAYTNVMGAWVLNTALEVYDLLDMDRREELLEDLGIDGEELDRWGAVSRRMFVPFHAGTIISQFEGYESLKELDWDYYTERYGESMRLDRILESENDSVNNYKASKQADVLMLFYLLSADELEVIFNRLGYQFNHEMIPENVAYYQKRTSHGSTLSRLIHSWVLSRLDRVRSWNEFKKALLSDVEDVQGGTTPEGIHLGAMAGTVDIMQRCYTGLEIRKDVLWLNPRLPEHVDCVKLRLRYRSHWIAIVITRTQLEISAEEGWQNRIQVGVGETIYTIEKRQSVTIPWNGKHGH